MSSMRRGRRRNKAPSPSPEPPSSPEQYDDANDADDVDDVDNPDMEMDEEDENDDQSNDEDDQEDENEDDNSNDEESPTRGNSSGTSMNTSIDPHVDKDTLRILVSTDNHLGYAERDPIRGNDSFAAFEEVLLLAKRHNCDMVLLAGDLFHENKPTRRTLHKTMNILRRYTMGPNPISFQILSDQTQNFRSTAAPFHTVNYENPYISIDLPIFSIHGNHDDPTRDGGDEMLAALDILAMGSLVNYFGRQDEVDKIQVSPVLIKKGDTKVALYGMGSMRDERLNRMWQGKKVRFLKPQDEESGNTGNTRNGRGRGNDDDTNRISDSEGEKDDEDNEENGWLNIFALHQNRDLGRGSKNCVHESMIPEWMDLVVWGHEHECNIIPAESAVGTFRITQPGSSVATSLTEGESLTKHVGILDIRGQQFRLLPVPLMQVRSFAMGNIILSETGLDAEDLRVDDAMQEILAKEVEKLIREARSSSRLLKYNNERGGGGGGGDGNNDNNNSRNDSHNDNEEGENEEDDILVKTLNFHVEKPERVLVRLKVEHSGFSTLHNQRFGSRFVNEVANPSDILLFHRKRVNEAIKSSSNRGNNKSNNTSNSNGIPNDPTYPKEMEEINFEDIVKDLLDDAEKKLQILNEDTLTIAVEEFVSKEQKQMITETVSKILNKQQKSLVKRGGEGGDLIDGDKDDTEVKLTTVNAVREVCQTETQKIREAEFSMDIDGEEDEGEDNVENNESPKKKPPARKRGHVQRSQSQYDEDDNDEDVSVDASIKEKKRNNRSTKTSRSNGAVRGGGQKRVRRNTQKYDSESEFEEDDNDEAVVEVPTPKPKKRKAPAKRRGRAVQQQQSSSEDDDDDVIVENISPPSRRNRSQGRAVGRGSRRSATKRSYEEEVIEIDDNDNDALESSGWGTACSQPTPAKRSRRRK